MSGPPTVPARPAFRPWWPVPAVAALVVATGAAVYWSQTGGPGDAASDRSHPASTRTVPPPVTDGPAGVHSVKTDQEHGIKVIRIQVVPNGDELIVDAATGRLIEARPPAKR